MWAIKVSGWERTPFSRLDHTALSKELHEYFNISIEGKSLENPTAAAHLYGLLEPYIDTMPIIEQLRGKELRAAHWAELSSTLQTPLDHTSPSFTLKKLLGLGLGKLREKILSVTLKAKRESEIESSLQTLIEVWEGVDLSIVYEQKTDIYLLLETEELALKMEEAMVTLSTLFNNKYVAPILDRVEHWYTRFKQATQVFEAWLKFHRLWVGLDRVFQNPDTSKKLKEESRSFQYIDLLYRERLKSTVERPNALRACSLPKSQRQLDDWIRTCEYIQKSIEKYLDEQRELFTRYFFLSNEELLMIIQNA